MNTVVLHEVAIVGKIPATDFTLKRPLSSVNTVVVHEPRLEHELLSADVAFKLEGNGSTEFL